MSTSMFTRDGSAWVPTPAARGPWGETLHGGAPAALLAHVVEEAAGARLPLARLTLDLCRPVPSAPLEVSVRTRRSGRRVAMHEAVLASADKELVRASALHADETALEGDLTPPAAPLPDPETLEETSLSAGVARAMGQWLAGTEGLHTRLLVRRSEGMEGAGVGAAWLHLPLALTPGVALTPTTHLAAVSDFANGLAQRRIESPQGRIGFINADITLHVLRVPDARRIGMTARNEASRRGRGLVSAECWDTGGLVARVTQTTLAVPAA